MWCFPRRCPVCGRSLKPAEHDICTRCLVDLPFSRQQGAEGNIVEQQFWGRIPIERAATLMVYHRGARSHQLVRTIKYKGGAQTGVAFGRMMARQLLPTGFFEGIDMIVPVPLSAAHRRQRGYNQAERLAHGVGLITGLSVVTRRIQRVVATETQTSLDRMDRLHNVEGAFYVDGAERFHGKHLLLVDDVVTTGATLLSLAQAFVEVCQGVRFSVLTLAQAASLQGVPYHRGVDDDAEDAILPSTGHIDLSETDFS